MIAISLLLCALGVWAAWNVQRQHMIGSDLIAREVNGMIAAHEMYLGLREIRNHLQQYLRSNDPRELDRAEVLVLRFPQELRRTRELTPIPFGPEMLSLVEAGEGAFLQGFTAVRQWPADDLEGRREAVGRLLDDTLTPRLVDPAGDFVEGNRQLVSKTNEVNRKAAEQLRQAFLLLGLCGGGGGLVAGLAIARAISRSIIELDVSIQGVAGHLHGALGGVSIRRVEGFKQLEVGLQDLQEHIITLVERLQQRELEVLRADQLAAVGQLAAGMAHELRNPLMPMKMLVQQALEREGGLQGQALRIVDQEITRLERSIQEFLDFARPPKLQTGPVNLSELVRQVCDLLRSRADRQDVQLQEYLPVTPLWLDADGAQLRQMILNLLLNALDVQTDGGVIELELDEQSSRTTVGAAARWLRIVVRDEGPGLEPRVMERLFEPFLSTKETGTGLGLSICRRIVQAHGGVILAGNRHHRGAEFQVTLPAEHPSHPSTEAEP